MMTRMKPSLVYRSIINTRVFNVDTLYQTWHDDLNLAQQSILVQAGILPFLKAVIYPSDNALCSAVIDFMMDGKLTVGKTILELTEEEIHEATRLPNCGRDISPSTDYDGFEIIISLTKSQTDASFSRLMLDDIVDPVVQYASKFLVYKVLGYAKKQDYIPFKYVETAIDVAHGVCFNWCKFIKDRMMQQIEVIHREHKGIFTYPTILQCMAFRAFNDNCIPCNVIGEEEPYINAYNICGRNVAKTTDEKRIVNEGISCIIENILKEHEYRVVAGSTLKKAENTKKQKRKPMHDICSVYKGGGCKKARIQRASFRMFLGSSIVQKSPAESEISVNELPSPSKSHTEELSNMRPGLSNDIKESDCINIDNSSMLLASPQPSESKSTCLFQSFDQKLKFCDHTTEENNYERGEDLKAIKTNNVEGSKDSVSVKQAMEVCMLTHQQLAQQQEQQEDKELHDLRIENSRLWSEKLQWELEKAMLEAQKMQLVDEKAHAWQEKEQLEIENSCLRAQLLEKVQSSAELQRKLNKMKNFWGCND